MRQTTYCTLLAGSLIFGVVAARSSGWAADQNEPGVLERVRQLHAQHTQPIYAPPGAGLQLQYVNIANVGSEPVEGIKISFYAFQNGQRLLKELPLMDLQPGQQSTNQSSQFPASVKASYATIQYEGQGSIVGTAYYEDGAKGAVLALNGGAPF